jgi:hypothetical protein
MVNPDEKTDASSPLWHEADKLIAGLGGDARVAVIELIWGRQGAKAEQRTIGRLRFSRLPASGLS